MSNPPQSDARLARMRFRAWHRGTREADYMMGGFFDRYHAEWDEDALQWFEDLLDRDDVDVLAWALQTQAPPARFAGPLMQAFQRIDYVSI
jgi:antitoxin CptB